MPISINNPIWSTYIFLAVFVVTLILTFRKRNSVGLTKDITQELKGFAILAIIFAHIGYSLITDNRFLFPLSICAGVGVNLFLFLSGYGLVLSSVSKKIGIIEFYKKRLSKLYIPLWITLFIFFILDFFLLSKGYGWGYIGQSFLGFFPRANLFLDINSPLWYFSFIIFYYLLFPIVFYRKRPWLSGMFLFLISYLLVFWNPAFLSKVMGLYRLHIIAFPLGVFIAGLISEYKESRIINYVKEIWQKIEFRKILRRIIYLFSIGLLIFIISYTAYYSNVGKLYWLEQGTSLITVGAIIILFSILKFKNHFFYLFGLYSYEVYLLHWPILYRFDVFYRFIPAWLATILYLGLFIVLAWFMKKVEEKYAKI